MDRRIVGEEMKRGIILEVKDKYAIVLEEGGSYNALNKKDNMIIGERIAFENDDYYQERLVKDSSQPKIRGLLVNKYLAIAMVLFVITLTSILPGIFKDDTYALVSIDVNPSFTLEINQKQKILAVKGLNQDALKLSLKNLKGQFLKDGLDYIHDVLKKEGYLNGNSHVLVGFAMIEQWDDEFNKNIKVIAEKSFSGEKILLFESNNTVAKEANDKGISIGRFEAARRLKKDESVISKMTVKEIEDLFDTDNDNDNYDNDDIPDSMPDKKNNNDNNNNNDDDNDETYNDTDEEDDDKDKD